MFNCSQGYIAPGLIEIYKYLHAKVRLCYRVWRVYDRCKRDKSCNAYALETSIEVYS